MTTTKLLATVAALFILAGVGYVVISPRAQVAQEVGIQKDAPYEYAASSTDEVKPEEGATTPKPSETQPSATPEPAPEQPAPTVPQTPSGYTKADVAMHASDTSCWSIINGSVYDLTSYISKHPGGERNILRICGTDGTSSFDGQHGGESRPEKILESYYIGKLVQ